MKRTILFFGLALWTISSYGQTFYDYQPRTNQVDYSKISENLSRSLEEGARAREAKLKEYGWSSEAEYQQFVRDRKRQIKLEKEAEENAQIAQKAQNDAQKKREKNAKKVVQKAQKAQKEIQKKREKIEKEKGEYVDMQNKLRQRFVNGDNSIEATEIAGQIIYRKK